MRRHIHRTVTALVVALAALAFSTQINSTNIAQDDETPTCPAQSEQVRAAAAACAGAEAGTYCWLAPDEDTATIRPASALEGTGTPADLGGLVSFSIAAGQAGAEVVPVRVLAYGDATITDAASGGGDSAGLTLTATNTAGYTINLRGGPGTDHPVVAAMDRNTEAVADARDASGEWVRLTPESLGLGDDVPEAVWVSLTLVTLDGAVGDLPVAGGATYSQPFQAMLISSDPDVAMDCGGGASGVLVTHPGAEPAALQINGVDLSFNQAAFLVTAVPDEALRFTILRGVVAITTAEGAISAGEGAVVSVAVAYLTAAGAPDLSSPYPFAAVTGLPFDLLPADQAVCVAGLPVESGLVPVRTGPGEAYPTIFNMSEDAYPVSGQFSPAEATGDWWQVSIAGYAEAWVAQSDVQTVGVCGLDAVAVVETAPPLVDVGAAESGSGARYLPAGQSVWQANSGPDVMTGQCETPPIAVCNHLVAILPNDEAGSSITWRGQEPQPYTLTQTGPNTYAYSGPSVLGNGSVRLALTFTGPGSWSLTFTTIYADDPDCEHTFYYTATRSW